MQASDIVEHKNKLFHDYKLKKEELLRLLRGTSVELLLKASGSLWISLPEGRMKSPYCQKSPYCILSNPTGYTYPDAGGPGRRTDKTYQALSSIF